MKLRDIVKITMNGKVKIPNSGLHDVYTIYSKMENL